jgi:hypothetical protein
MVHNEFIADLKANLIEHFCLPQLQLPIQWVLHDECQPLDRHGFGSGCEDDGRRRLAVV